MESNICRTACAAPASSVSLRFGSCCRHGVLNLSSFNNCRYSNPWLSDETWGTRSWRSWFRSSRPTMAKVLVCFSFLVSMLTAAGTAAQRSEPLHVEKSCSRPLASLLRIRSSLDMTRPVSRRRCPSMRFAHALVEIQSEILLQDVNAFRRLTHLEVVPSVKSSGVIPAIGAPNCASARKTALAFSVCTNQEVEVFRVRGSE